MANMNAATGRQRFPSVPDGHVVASYRSYEQARAAVDLLARSEGFTLESTTIVGSDLKSIERVTGRMTLGRAVLSGVGMGVMMSLFVGLMWLTLNPATTVGSLLAIGIISLGFGVLWSVVGYLIARRRSEFTSMMQITASRYDVVVDHGMAGEAARILGPNAGSAQAGAGAGAGADAGTGDGAGVAPGAPAAGPRADAPGAHGSPAGPHTSVPGHFGSTPVRGAHVQTPGQPGAGSAPQAGHASAPGGDGASAVDANSASAADASGASAPAQRLRTYGEVLDEARRAEAARRAAAAQGTAHVETAQGMETNRHSDATSPAISDDAATPEPPTPEAPTSER